MKLLEVATLDELGPQHVTQLARLAPIAKPVADAAEAARRVEAHDRALAASVLGDEVGGREAGRVEVRGSRNSVTKYCPRHPPARHPHVLRHPLGVPRVLGTEPTPELAFLHDRAAEVLDEDGHGHGRRHPGGSAQHADTEVDEPPSEVHGVAAEGIRPVVTIDSGCSSWNSGWGASD